MGSGVASHASLLFPCLCLVVPPVVVIVLASVVKRSSAAEPSALDKEECRRVLTRLAFAGAAVLVLFLASLPTGKPFSSGQRLGIGILLGGLAATAAAMFDCCSRSWCRRGVGDVVRGFTATSIAVLAYSGLLTTLFAAGLLLYKNAPVNMFLGIGTGVLIVAFVHLIPQKLARSEDGPTEAFFEVFVCATVAVVAAILLAVLHYPGGLKPSALLTDQRFVWQMPLWIASVPFWMTLLWSLIGVLCPSLSPTARAGAVAALAFVDLAVKYPWLSKALYHDRTMMYPVAFGAIVGGLLPWLVARHAAKADESAGRRWLGAAETAVLVSLVMFVGVFVGFRFQAGYGVALGAASVVAMALCMLPLVAEQRNAEGRQDAGVTDGTLRLLTRALSILVSFALLRALLELANLSETSLSLHSHFVLFGLLLGCVFPFVLDAVRVVAAELTPEPRASTGLLTAFLIGFGAAVAAPGLFLFWGTNAVIGLFTGLLLCQTVVLFVDSATLCGAGFRRHAINLIAWGMTLPALKLVPLLEPHDSLVTRLHKIHAVIVLAVAFLVWSLVSANLRRGREEKPS